MGKDYEDNYKRDYESHHNDDFSSNYRRDETYDSKSSDSEYNSNYSLDNYSKRIDSSEYESKASEKIDNYSSEDIKKEDKPYNVDYFAKTDSSNNLENSIDNSISKSVLETEKENKYGDFAKYRTKDYLKKVKKLEKEAKTTNNTEPIEENKDFLQDNELNFDISNYSDEEDFTRKFMKGFPRIIEDDLED